MRTSRQNYLSRLLITKDKQFSLIPDLQFVNLSTEQKSESVLVCLLYCKKEDKRAQVGRFILEHSFKISKNWHMNGNWGIRLR